MSNHIPRLLFSRGTLLLQGVTHHQVGRFFEPGIWIWDSRVPGWRCDAIQYRHVQETLRRSGAQHEDLVVNWRAVHWPKVKLHPLRDDQQQARSAWLRTRQGCVVMPTGTGKTEIALSIMAEVATATLVVAPVRDLMYQWHRRIVEALGYDAGVIGDNVFRVAPVSVTTYDSACIHMESLGNRFGLIIFDECHHLPGPIRQDAARMSAALMRLGLTATPQRADGRHVDLDWLIGPIVYEMEISEAKGRTLADYEVVRIPVHLSPEEQSRYDQLSRRLREYMLERRKSDPQFSWEDLCAESGRAPESRRALRDYWAKKSIEDRAQEKLRVLEDIFRLHNGQPCLVFTGSNAMARDVSRRFLVPCLLSHCRKKERLDVLRGLADGTYPALVANQVLDEGVDLPEVKVAVVIGGQSSVRQAKQRLGRILRKRGAVKATLYEIVCAETSEEQRSRRRRSSDAFTNMRHRRRT